MRPALSGLPRYIATVETAKHRVFQFLDASILPDNRLVCFALDDAFHLGILSSRIHVVWALQSGGTLEDRPIYTKSVCFDSFPFPDCSDLAKTKIRECAEKLDAHRKVRRAEYPKISLTEIYNVLEMLRAGDALGEDDERVNREGAVMILKEIHDELDTLVAEAYRWPIVQSEEDIVKRLVCLNAARAGEEKLGKISWLRPDYQIPLLGSEADRVALKAASDAERATAKQSKLDFEDDEDDDDDVSKPKYPTGDELAETTAVLHALALAPAAISIDDISATFKGGLQNKRRVALCILALARLGHIASTDGGETFSLRRAA